MSKLEDRSYYIEVSELAVAEAAISSALVGLPACRFVYNMYVNVVVEEAYKRLELYEDFTFRIGCTP